MNRLYRTVDDRKIAGVCGGLGKYFNIDPTIVRIIMLLLIIPLNLGVILAYFIGVFVIPNETEVNR
ncbi:PspC domain-containing protein [Salipaludibacillus sp. CUR1]|uniref:Phage shock protein PspC (Stress-responsive transcriptional regulator) n=1 Tax=Salipaludibacillus aurantiacus TaxID=1601833 RepID=A0A1H9WX78_9BACI|nr:MULTISPECIES: PspC domain-containing protein [Salipaludibacillus]MCE7793141.1 PspC domain-containing protein [Salipaludibacillus sp. CUR1]SES38538.1 Phage shock protein PspC (stress-responsive transcriptional regulator) [Salipaludibacillus aurantiacus]